MDKKSNISIGNTVSMASSSDVLQLVPPADSLDNNYVRDIIGNKNDTPVGTSIYSGISFISQELFFMIVGSFPDLVTLGTMEEDAGTSTYLDAGGEQVIRSFPIAKAKLINGVWVDVSNLTQNGTIRLYYKIDGVNFRLINETAFTAGVSPDGIFIPLVMGIFHELQVRYQEAVDEGDDRDIYVAIPFEWKEL